MTQNIMKPKKVKSGYTWSLIFLILVVAGTVGLYFYNNNLAHENENIKSDILSIQNSIAEVEKYEDLQIYSLLQLNQKVIDGYSLMNNVVKYINHMNVVAAKNKVAFTGFSMDKGNIKTSVKTLSDDDAIAYQKTKDFIKNYRSDEKALFVLNFINGFEWMDDMRFDVNFSLK